MDIYIFRHGDTANSINFWKKFFKQKNTFIMSILPESHNSLKKIGKYLKKIETDANFTSPFPRCKESAEIVSEISKKIFRIDPRISELEGNTDFKKFRHDVKSFLDYLTKQKYSSVAICTHGAVIAAIKHFATSGNFHIYQVWDYPSPGNLVIIKNKKVRTVNFN